MGQQPAPFATWRSQNKPTSRDSAKPMGQQTRQSNVSHPAMEPDHVTKSKSRFETDRKIPSENERKPSDFAPYGMAVDHICFLATEAFASKLDCLLVEALDQGGCKIELVVYGQSPHEVQARLACTGIKLRQQRKSMLDFGAEFFTCPTIIADSEFGLCLIKGHARPNTQVPVCSPRWLPQ